MDRNYGGIVWTNHALRRLWERKIKQGDAWAAWRNPSQSKYAASKGARIYYRTFGDQRIEVAAKQNEKKEWIVLSVWSKTIATKNKPSKSLFQTFLEVLFKRV